eukprot:4744740-Alexandrium_andersonii.AAC.1
MERPCESMPGLDDNARKKPVLSSCHDSTPSGYSTSRGSTHTLQNSKIDAASTAFVGARPLASHEYPPPKPKA